MDQTGSRDFIYQALPFGSIRILTVRPSPSLDATLDCTIEAVPLGEDASYTALSYCWAYQDGDISLCRELKIEGQPVAIRRNLFEALRRLRRTDEDLRIWIDALCIDQNNDEERTEQVSNMAAVFKTADRVVAWLGEGDEDKNANMLVLLLDMINRIEGDVGAQLENLFCDLDWEDWLDKLLTLRILELEKWVPPPGTWQPSTTHTFDTTLDVLDAFLSRRYFTRRWILQEIAHACNETIELHWGSRSFSGLWRFYGAQHLLTWSLHMFYCDSSNPQALRERCMSMYDTSMAFQAIMNSTLQPFPTLPRILSACNNLKCSDPRDIVYSLISIAPGCGIVPDYGLKLVEVYARAAEYMWCSGRADDVCNNLPHCGPLNTGFPSWVFDLRKGFYHTGQSDEFLKSRMQAMQPSVDENSILSCHLTYLGTVCPGGAQGNCFQLRHKDTGVIAEIKFSGYMPDLEAMIVADDVLFTLPGPRLDLPPYHKVLLLRKVSGQRPDQESNLFVLERRIQAKFDIAKLEGLGGFTDEWELDVKSPDFQRKMDALMAELPDPRWPRPNTVVRIK